MKAEQNTKLFENEYALTDNNFSKFDLSFLKDENDIVSIDSNY